MDDDERKIETILRKYAMHYASFEKPAIEFGVGETLPSKIEFYTAYANFLSTRRIEKLNRMLAYSTVILSLSTLTLAIFTAISIFMR
jgi:hypothetical protein